mgnify:CR=1 FL=1
MGNQAATKALLAVKNINVNITNNQGNTPLHMIISRGDEAFARLLLAKGARTDIKNGKGKTPVAFSQTSTNEAIRGLFSKSAS